MNVITIDNSLVSYDALYCGKLDSLPLQELFTAPKFVLQPPGSKELDLLANPFQLSKFATLLSIHSGGRHSLNSIQINATMIGGPRVLTVQRRYSNPNPLKRIERCTTSRTTHSTTMGFWSVEDVYEGFQYEIFHAIDDLSNVGHVVGAFLPRYYDGKGVDHQVWLDKHVNHHGDSWLPFMQAIECNLRRGLPTVLLSGSDAYMLIGFEQYSPSPVPNFEFVGYQLGDVPLSSRPDIHKINFEQEFFLNPFDENCLEEEIRDAMAFVAFEPI